MLEDRPASASAVGEAAQPRREPLTDAPGGPLGSSDHKQVGLNFIALSLLLGVVARLAGAAVAATVGGIALDGGNFGRLTSFADSGVVYLLLFPLFIGLATYVVPLQIGASRIAFPRTQALAFWMWAAGAVLFILGHVLGALPGVGLSGLSPWAAPGVAPIGPAGLIILASLLAMTIGLVLAAGNLVATVLSLRVDGMSLARMPLFSWATAAVCAGWLLAMPVFVAGLALSIADLRYGGESLFGGPGANLVWQKLLHLYNRPELLMLGAVALGIFGDVFTARGNKPLASPPGPAHLVPTGHAVAAALIGAWVVFSFGAWFAPISNLGFPTEPFGFSPTVLLLIPFGLSVLGWLGSFAKNKVRISPAVLYAFGFVACVGLGVVLVAVGQFMGRDDLGSSYLGGGVETILLGGPLLALAAGLSHWAPKLFGKALGGAAGLLGLLLLLGGAVLAGAGYWAAGFAGAAWRVKADAQMLALLAAAGNVLLLLGLALLLLATLGGLARRGKRRTAADPGDGPTLEWAADSPPVAGNFTTLPEVRSATPLLDAAPETGDAGVGATAPAGKDVP